MESCIYFLIDSSQFFVRCFSLAFFILLGGDTIAIDEYEKMSKADQVAMRVELYSS